MPHYADAFRQPPCHPLVACYDLCRPCGGLEAQHHDDKDVSADTHMMRGLGIVELVQQSVTIKTKQVKG